jgi:formate/nitrite transporter FocA (FNT family)
VGVAKAELDALSMFVLTLLAGAFIALGASFDTVAVSGSGEMAFGVKKVSSGLVFSGRFVGSIGAAAIVFFTSLSVWRWRCGSNCIEE